MQKSWTFKNIIKYVNYSRINNLCLAYFPSERTVCLLYLPAECFSRVTLDVLRHCRDHTSLIDGNSWQSFASEPSLWSTVCVAIAAHDAIRQESRDAAVCRKRGKRILLLRMFYCFCLPCLNVCLNVTGSS